MSQCDTNLVRRLEEDFKITLQQQNSLEEWANWLKSVVDEVLKPYVGKKSYVKAAREFLLKWSFYRYIFTTCLNALLNLYLIATRVPFLYPYL